MFQNKLNFRLLNILILMLVLYLGVSTVGVWGSIVARIIGILSPFIIAFAVAYALHPFVKFLERKGVRKHLAVAIVSVTIILLIVAIVSVTLPLIYDQLILFSKMIVQFIQDISSKFDLNLGDFQIAISDTLNGAIKSLGKVVSDGTVDILGRSIGVLTQFIIILIVSIYLLFDMDKIKASIGLFLKKWKEKAYHYVKSLDSEIGHYLHGLALFMIIQLFEYSLLFFIVGHPNWLLLGILACITTVIPYFGGLITNVIAVITASVVSTPLFVATLIICLIFPQIDGYVISPKIYGKTNNINPVLAIAAVSVGGSLAGFTGIVIALPTFILLSCTYRFFKADIKKRVRKVKDAI